MNEDYVKLFTDKIMGAGLAMPSVQPCRETAFSMAGSMQPYSPLRDVPIVQSNSSQTPRLAADSLLK